MERQKMSAILCRWLNDELRLSQVAVPKTFAKNFSSGYLIGEILHEYQLQNDFSTFTKKEDSISKRSNFSRLEPTLQSLGISFNKNTAQELMEEKEGAATHLLYQLYVSLEKKKKAQIGRRVMEIMQPAASASLLKKECDIYPDRLHLVVKHDPELKLQKIFQHSDEKWPQLNERSVKRHPIQQQIQPKVQESHRARRTEKAAVVHVPKPPPSTSQLRLKRRMHQQQRKAQQAQSVQTEIAQFETNKKKLVTDASFASFSSGKPPGDLPLDGCSQACNILGSGDKLVLQSNSKYIKAIRQRLRENTEAQEQRQRRLDRFLVEQHKTHKAQEDARRDEQLMKRLTRQTRQEQRLVAHLLQIRGQKEVIRQNSLFREQQLRERRERDIQEALQREEALAQQAKLKRAEDIRRELEFLNRAAAERDQTRYNQHFGICKDISEQIVDLTSKVGEYRLLTGNLNPGKPVREWKELLFRGLPLYEPSNGQPGSEFAASANSVERQKQEILNNQDYDEYTSMVGDWAWPEDTGETKLPPANNNILRHVIERLRSIVHLPSVEPPLPSFPHFTLKACVLGKFCSGKSTCLSKIAKGQGIFVLSANTLIKDALNAYQNAEEVTQQQEVENDEQLLMSSTSLKPGLGTHEECRDRETTLSAPALLGATAEEELRRGNAIPNELLVNIIVEAIRQIPAQSSWILDGFPLDITQAHLLEKALGGAVEVEAAVVDTSANLAGVANPPEPPPPAPALDLVLLLDVSDECAVRRAFAHADKAFAAAAASCSTDQTLHRAQIRQRIPAFHDTWPELERWFGAQQSILTRVDADVEEEELYKKVESVLQQVIMKTKDARAPSVEDGDLNSQKAPDSSSPVTPPLVDQPPHLKDEASGLTESHSSLNEDKDPSMASLPTSSSPKGHSRKVSTSSGTQENPPEAASPCPGSASWVYVDEPIPPELAESLCSDWAAACDSYVNNVKTVMQLLRSQRNLIDHQLYNIREEYKQYLGRPDLKKEFVSQWQSDFNSLQDDMRDDDEKKAKLHLSLDELCERLWDVIKQRREANEQEMAAIMSGGWLEDHAAILINHHSILLQVEMDRLQATIFVLRVYYLSMCNQVLPEQHSSFGRFHPLNILETENQDMSTEPKGATVDDKKATVDDKKDKRKSSLHPDISVGVSKTTGQALAERVRPALEKLISDYEEVFSGISKLVSAETQPMETKQQEKMQETNLPKASGSAKKAGRKSSKKQKGHPSPHPEASPAPDDDKNSENAHDQEVKKKIQKEYAAALDHEEKAAKVRISLVKGRGLAKVQSLQSRAEQVLSSMQQWVETHYLDEMKSIDQLAEVVRHHIEAGDKLKYQLVLESTDFYMNARYRMAASPPLSPSPPSLEKPFDSTPTTTQLESLHQQLCTVAPSGFMSSSEFLTLLKDIISVNEGNILPEPWISKTETKVLEIVSLLKDDYDLIDWRRFLLSAALPWPFPSLTQLLAALQRFKAADVGNTGYVNEEQYLQTQLWFSNDDSVQPVPENPSEPLPYNRLANLHKFFFKLFADQSVSPPCLDYISMLRYFAADPQPRRGFIRTLSVVMGQHLKCSSPSHLVQSMATIGEAKELCSSDVESEDEEEESPCASTTSASEQDVSIPALLDVICHKITKMKDGSPLPPGCPSQEEHTERLVQIFSELGYKPEDHVPISVLSHHPFIQGLMETSTTYQLVDIHRVFLSNQDEGEPDSLTVS